MWDNSQEAICMETTQAMSPYHHTSPSQKPLPTKASQLNALVLPLRPNLQQKPTKAGLLNALDGPTANIGNMLFMTTNNYDAFDNALIKHCVHALSHNWTDTPSQDTAQSHTQGRRKTKDVSEQLRERPPITRKRDREDREARECCSHTIQSSSIVAKRYWLLEHGCQSWTTRSRPIYWLRTTEGLKQQSSSQQMIHKPACTTGPAFTAPPTSASFSVHTASRECCENTQSCTKMISIVPSGRSRSRIWPVGIKRNTGLPQHAELQLGNSIQAMPCKSAALLRYTFIKISKNTILWI